MYWVLVVVGSVGFAVLAGRWLLSRIADAGGAVDGDAGALAGQVIAQAETLVGRSDREPWDGRLRPRELKRTGSGL